MHLIPLSFLHELVALFLQLKFTVCYSVIVHSCIRNSCNFSAPYTLPLQRNQCLAWRQERHMHLVW